MGAANLIFFVLDSVVAWPCPPTVGLLSILVLFFLTSLGFFFLRQRASNHAKGRRLPPGPAPWPIFGSLLTMLHHKPRFRWVLAVADGKDIACIRLGGVHVVVVNSPELGLEFLRKHDATFASRPLTMSTGHISPGFISVGVAPWGEQWKKMRRVVQSELLNPSRFRSLSSLRDEEADHFVKYLYNSCNEGLSTIDLRTVARYYSGNVIRKMVFGIRHFGNGGEYGGPGEEEIEYMHGDGIQGVIFDLCLVSSRFYAIVEVAGLGWT